MSETRKSDLLLSYCHSPFHVLFFCRGVPNWAMHADAEKKNVCIVPERNSLLPWFDITPLGLPRHMPTIQSLGNHKRTSAPSAPRVICLLLIISPPSTSTALQNNTVAQPPTSTETNVQSIGTTETANRSQDPLPWQGMFPMACFL